MRFNIKKHEPINKDKYRREDFLVATEFAKKLYKEFGNFLKAVVLFGSTARQKAGAIDIDILVIVDDINIVITEEISEAYRIITEKLVLNTSKRLHVTTFKFTTFWEYIRNGDPIAINVLRDGVALIDQGIFDPWQALLMQGRIRPTPESIRTYFDRAPITLKNARWHILQAVIDLYWAVVDASHALLMKIGEVPPSPAELPEMIDKHLAKKGLLQQKDVNTVHLFFRLYKMITHNELRLVSGPEFDSYIKLAEDYVNRVEQLIKS